MTDMPDHIYAKIVPNTIEVWHSFSGCGVLK